MLPEPGAGMSSNNKTIDLLQQLASRPGHDEVKADFRELLIEEFGAELRSLDFERRVPEVRGRLDALIGRTVLEAKSDLDREWGDVERRMPDYLADREREEGEHFVGIATDGLKWAVFELCDGALVTVKQTSLDPEKPEPFLAWLDGALALKSSLSPDALTIRAELGADSVAYHLVQAEMARLWGKLSAHPAEALKRQLWAGRPPQARLWSRGPVGGTVVPAQLPRHCRQVHRRRGDGPARRRSTAHALRRGVHVRGYSRRGRE